MERNKQVVAETNNVGHTLVQTEDAQKLSRQLSELHDLKQHPDAPKIPAYLLIKPIGRGAYAQVWEALQTHTRKLVAVKVFTKKSGVHWFFLQREAERLIRLDKHPHIVSLLDADLSGSVPYYVMDLAQEGSLEKILEREKATEEGRLDNEKVADWMKEIAQALSYVHSKQMVHCDLKPANVLLDEEGHVRVADFGHSRVLSESGGALGTLFFMAPEQAVPPNEGEPPQPDIRWDVYALGCTAYALLSRHVPHAEIEDRLEKTPGLKERLQLYRQAVESEPVPELWESTQHRVDRDLSSIVAKCMKTDPEERYQSVAEVLADLKARHENRPVSPLAGDRIYWIGKFFARYRLSASVTVAALLVALGALYLTTRNQRTQLQDTALNDVLRGREFLDKGDEASAGAYFAASNKILPTLLARGNAVLDKPPIPRWVFRHEGEVTTVAYSRDGKVLLTADAESGIRLWDWQTGRPLGPFLKLKGDVTCAVFNPEGSKIALGDSNGQIRIWKVEGQKPLARVMDQGREITCLSFSPNGRQVAAGCSDGTVRLWDAEKGRPVGPPMGQEEAVFQIQFSRDGRLLLTAGREGTARIWEVKSGEARDKPVSLKLKGAPVWYKPDVVFSPDGKTILATGWDGSVAFYDFHGKRKGRPLFLEGIGAHAAFSPDGKWILASVIYGGSVGLARVWNVETHLARKFFLRDPGQILALDFNSDGTEILTGSADHTARIWDSQTGKPLGDAYWHGDSVTMGLFGPQDGTFFTASKDGLARLWNISDVREGQVRLDWKAAGREYSRKVQNHALFSPDGQRIATYSGKTVYLWNGSTGAGLGPPLAASGTILRVVFSPDSATFLTCDSDNQSRLWDLKTGGFKALPQEGPVRGGFFSADGKTLLTGSEDGTLRVWDLRAGKAWGSPLSTGMMVMRTFLSPDGERIAAMGKGGALRLYPLRKENAKALVKIDKGIRNAAFSSDGRYLIAAGSSSVTLFDTSNGKPLRKFEGGQGLQSLFPGPDGKTLATFGSDGTGRIWNLATGDSVGNSLKHAGPLQGACFSPKGEILFATYQDGTGQFWDVQTAEPIGTPRPLGSLALDSVFGEGGQGLAVVLRDGRVLNLDTSWLSPSMNADSLLTSTEVAGLCRVDSHGSVEPLKMEEWLKLWRRTQEAKK